MTAPTKSTLLRPTGPHALLSVRTLLILTTATLIGVGVGVLTAMAGQRLTAAVIAGLTAGGASAVALNTVVGH